MRRTTTVAVLLALLLAGGGSATAASGRWSWPVVPHRIARGFEAPASAYAAGHRGIDLAAPVGTAVLAPDDGRVAFAGRVADRIVVAVDHAGVRSTLEPLDPEVRTGDRVRRGQVIGRVATGGDHAAGTLHLGARVRQGGGWAYVSPLLLLGGAQRAVLLPLSAFPG